MTSRTVGQLSQRGQWGPDCKTRPAARWREGLRWFESQDFRRPELAAQAWGCVGSVTITIANGMLVIAGEKTEESEDTEQDYHVSERRWGSFQRAIRMPENVDEAKIEATSAKGVLTVTLPKSDKGRSADRKIPVKAG